MIRRVLALLLLLAVPGGCTRERGTSADPTVPPETSVATTPPTSAPPDVASIPPVIDEDYLNRVLAALDEVDGRATRIIVDQKKLAPAAAELLAAIYDEEEFSDQSRVWLTTHRERPRLQILQAESGKPDHGGGEGDQPVSGLPLDGRRPRLFADNGQGERAGGAVGVCGASGREVEERIRQLESNGLDHHLGRALFGQF